MTCPRCGEHVCPAHLGPPWTVYPYWSWYTQTQPVITWSVTTPGTHCGGNTITFGGNNTTSGWAGSA